LVVAAACTAETAAAPVDLGEFPFADKADAVIEVEVPFEVAAAVGGLPGETELTFRTWGRLSVKTEQDEARSWERLQLVAARDDLTRRSWRGRSPYLTVTPREAGTAEDYTLTVLNWGARPAYGTLVVTTEPPPAVGVEVRFNSPDCLDCEDPAGELRETIIGVIQGAEQSLEVAIYGLSDPDIIDALCNAAEDGIAVTLVTDETSEDPDDSRSYYSSFLGDTGLAACGAHVEFVRSHGLMHHKFIVADAEGDRPVLLTGSTNFTQAGLEANHNHVVVVRGQPELIASYTGELGQFYRHCATERRDSRTCTECSPACTEDASPNGRWPLPGGGSIEALFSPGDDAMRALRGDARSESVDTPDPACTGPDANCICRISGRRYVCEYCALGDDGFGLIGEADERIWMSIYSATDSCFALGAVRAAERGVSVRTVWDFVKSGSAYSRDDYLCGHDIEAWVTNWGNGSAQVRNHNKSVVVDDVLFTGSMNLSASGAAQNNENTLVIRDAAAAETFAAHIAAEIDLLQHLGVTQRDAADCRCNDIVDNDGDGLFDADDPDCDAG
jgi:phosphatidylserine/phosphatidylglycerophosphate/cardiolipin synthase-like enzyme